MICSAERTAASADAAARRPPGRLRACRAWRGWPRAIPLVSRPRALLTRSSERFRAIRGAWRARARLWRRPRRLPSRSLAGESAEVRKAANSIQPAAALESLCHEHWILWLPGDCEFANGSKYLLVVGPEEIAFADGARDGAPGGTIQHQRAQGALLSLDGVRGDSMGVAACTVGSYATSIAHRRPHCGSRNFAARARGSRPSSSRLIGIYGASPVARLIAGGVIASSCLAVTGRRRTLAHALESVEEDP